MRYVLSLALLFCAAWGFAQEPTVVRDCGYWTGDYTGQDGTRKPSRWVSIPTKLLLVGRTDPQLTRMLGRKSPLFVFQQANQELQGGSELVDPLEYGVAGLAWLQVVRPVSVQEIEVSLRK